MSSSYSTNDGRQTSLDADGATAVSARAGQHDVAREKEQFGGIKFGSAFFGWLTATGTAVLLTALVAAAGTAVGIAQGTDVGEVAGAATSNPTTAGITSAIVLLLVLLIAYYCAVLVAGLGAVAGNKYDVLASLNAFPRLPINEGTLTSGGTIALVVAALSSLVGAVLGGLAGMRFHRKVDQAGLRH